MLFESPIRLVRLLEDLVEACGGARRVAVARELTKLHEEIFRGTLADAVAYYGEHPARGEVTLVVEGASETAEVPLDEEDVKAIGPRADG